MKNNIMKNLLMALGTLFLLGATAPAQEPPKRALVGTVLGIDATGEIRIKPDGADPVAVKLAPATVLVRIAPGEKDLKKAAPITAGDISAEDRVLVTLDVASGTARRIVLMSSEEISRKDEADSLDWMRRGVSGVVTGKHADEIAIRLPSLQGEIQKVVVVTESTTFRRYVPDSIRFADARPSSAAEISAGDQLRTRGKQSEDGAKIWAENIVFGTFLTKAGTVLSVNLETKEVAVRDFETGKPLTIRIAAESTIKRLPDLSTLLGSGQRSAAAADLDDDGAASPRDPKKPKDKEKSQPSLLSRFKGMSLAQLLEMLPASKPKDIKPGESVVVSSTRGSSGGRVTAIMVIANADMLLEFASLGNNFSPLITSTLSSAAASGMLNQLGLSGIMP